MRRPLDSEEGGGKHCSKGKTSKVPSSELLSDEYMARKVQQEEATVQEFSKIEGEATNVECIADHCEIMMRRSETYLRGYCSFIVLL